MCSISTPRPTNPTDVAQDRVCDIGFYYTNIRQNVEQRISAYLKKD